MELTMCLIKILYVEFPFYHFQGTYKTESTLNLVLNLTNNGQVLQCEIRHHALTEMKSVSVPIMVYGSKYIHIIAV